MMAVADLLRLEVLAGSVRLPGDLRLPPAPSGLVVFAHGSGSGRRSPRNRLVAGRLEAQGLATFLVDLLAADEGGDRRLIFDVRLLAERLAAATLRATALPALARLPIGYFGASTGAAAALVAAAASGGIAAVVSRGGRPDLAGMALESVLAPTLLIVGGRDLPVIPLNEAAFGRLRCERELVVVPGATHLFEEPGALERVAELAAAWFDRYLPSPGVEPAG